MSSEKDEHIKIKDNKHNKYDSMGICCDASLGQPLVWKFGAVNGAQPVVLFSQSERERERQTADAHYNCKQEKTR